MNAIIGKIVNNDGYQLNRNYLFKIRRRDRPVYR